MPCAPTSPPLARPAQRPLARASRSNRPCATASSTSRRPERKKLTGKLENWHELDFAAFRDEVKKAFRSDIPVKERGDWEAYLAENAAEVRRLTDEIATAEREIDQIVYRLFDLTPDEIALLEASLAGQY